MANEVAREGEVFVCLVCGKRSKDRFGDQAIDKEWDESCFLNSVLCNESSLVMKNGRVIEVQAK